MTLGLQPLLPSPICNKHMNETSTLAAVCDVSKAIRTMLEIEEVF